MRENIRSVVLMILMDKTNLSANFISLVIFVKIKICISIRNLLAKNCSNSKHQIISAMSIGICA